MNDRNFAISYAMWGLPIVWGSCLGIIGMLGFLLWLLWPPLVAVLVIPTVGICWALGSFTWGVIGTIKSNNILRPWGK